MLFYLFAGLALLGGLLVVANPFSRNPVTSAMALVLTSVALAGLFVLLHAFFLAAVQVLITAGAVLVLFLFVIMLLDLRAEERRRVSLAGWVAGAAAAGGLGALLVRVFWVSALGRQVAPPVEGSARALGEALVTRYLLPLEMVAVLLVVAVVGVVVLSRKDAA